MPLMDNLALHASSQKLALGFTANPRTDGTISNKPLFFSFKIPKRSGAIYKSSSFISTPRAINKSNETLGKDLFARSSSSSNQDTSSEVGSVLFWVGVGVTLSPVFSWAASYLEKYVMEQASKMMGKTDTQTNKSANAGSSQGSAATSAPATRRLNIVVPANGVIEIEVKHIIQSATSQGSAATSAVTVDEPPVTKKATPAPTESKDESESESPKDSNKSGMPFSLPKGQELQDMLKKIEEIPEWDNRMIDALKDFDPHGPEVKEQLGQVGLTLEKLMSKFMADPDLVTATQNPRVQAAMLDFFESPMNIIKYLNDKEVMDVFNKLIVIGFGGDACTLMGQMDTQNSQSANAGFAQGSAATSAPASQLTVTVDVPPTKTEAPESKDESESPKEPNNSEMAQSPQNHQQAQDMLINLEGSPELNNLLLDALKDFDPNSPVVKEDFDRIGLTLEEVISKAMGNPDVVMACQNPRVQAAIMDLAENPKSIIKYQDDKEVMDVFNKISEIFPGMIDAP